MKDSAQFRERFKRWKLGELVYENGRPLQQYRGGKDDEEQSQDDAIYSEFHKTLPKNLQSGNYRMRRYWELNGKPKDFYQGAIKGMFSPESNGWHAKSVAYDAENNVYELMKPNSHPTRWMEDREYQNTPDFKKDWVVEKSIFGENGYDRYVPRHRRLDGGMHYTNLPEFKAGKDGDDNADRVKITERRHGNSVLYTTDKSFKDSYQEELDDAYKQFKDTLPMSKIIQMVNANRANSIRNAWKEVGLVPRINPDDEIIMASRGYNGEKLSESPYESFVSLLGPSLYRKLHQRKVKNVDTVYDNMIRQLAYESNYGRSNIAKKHHNYGGVGFNGLKYSAFKSDDEFLDRYLDIMTGRHKNALMATTPSGYAKALKLSGYYEDSYENYSRNLSGMKTVSRVALAHKKSNYDLYYPKMSEQTAVLVLQNNPQFLPQPITSDASVPYKPDNEYEEQEQINAAQAYKNLFGPLSTNKNNITFNDILLLYENLYGEVPTIK